jgi:hypothetical protein
MPAAPASVYLSLHTADPGLTGTSEVGAGVGYTRQVVTLTAPLDSGADELVENTAEVVFGPATGAGFGTVTHFGLWTASTAGNFLEGGSSAVKTVPAGDSYRFIAGAAEFTLR